MLKKNVYTISVTKSKIFLVKVIDMRKNRREFIAAQLGFNENQGGVGGGGANSE